VPIYSGGAVRNSVRGAETRVDGGRANLRGAEADVFTDTVTAYVDVLRDEAIVRLNQQNVMCWRSTFRRRATGSKWAT
jgi:outer membrane protein